MGSSCAASVDYVVVFLGEEGCCDRNSTLDDGEEVGGKVFGD